ncbi:MAG TPA: GNAT family N-acetyltransferase [Steroidobacteraceae bacterium]|jgi:RimJ/RimL family protein N-acetyltransferase|nr:GNAT family N-acetyltransferase [Steroidobacteraceae bacterium]
MFDVNSCTLQTDRLLLRELAFSDFDAVHAYAADPVVTRYTSFGPNTPEETHAFLSRCIAAGATTPRRSHTFAAVERASGRLIGSCGLQPSDDTGRHFAFGYCFNQHWWRRGFGKEAATAIVQFGFEHLQAHRLWAQVFTGNAASVRILEGLAFRQEGLALQSLFLRTSWHDILTFAQLRTEWVALQ